MHTVIPAGNARRLSNGHTKRRKLHSMLSSSPQVIPTSGQKLTPGANVKNRMQSSFVIPVGGSIPSNNVNSQEIFDTAYPD